MATSIIFNRGDNFKMMNSLCQGLNDLVQVCSNVILTKCFNFDTIHQIDKEMLDSMKTSIDTTTPGADTTPNR